MSVFNLAQKTVISPTVLWHDGAEIFLLLAQSDWLVKSVLNVEGPGNQKSIILKCH
jgi:hypothetical protein